AQNLSIFLLVFILLDFAMDVSFIALHGNDLTWTYSVSLALLITPIALNIITTFFIISDEQAINDKFFKWWLKYQNSSLIFIVFSLIDLDFLNIMSSRFAGIQKFNAPFSHKTRRTVFIMNIVNLVIEDFGQAIVLILYQVYTVLPHIIPILVLSSCLFVIFIKFVTSSSFMVAFCQPRIFGVTDDLLKEPKRPWYKKKSSDSDFQAGGEYKGIASGYNEPDNNGIKNDVPKITENYNVDASGGRIFSLKKVDAKVHNIPHGKRVEDAIINVEEDGKGSTASGSELIYGPGKVYGSATSLPKRSSDFGIIGYAGKVIEGEAAIIEGDTSGLSAEHSAVIESTAEPETTQVQQTLVEETPLETTTSENIDDQTVEEEAEPSEDRSRGPRLARIGSVDTYQTSAGRTATTISRSNTIISQTTLESEESTNVGRRTSSGDYGGRIKREVSSEMMSDITKNEGENRF
ncbi:10841_t:CDS:2, partial [Acaulospora morrowiae]